MSIISKTQPTLLPLHYFITVLIKFSNRYTIAIVDLSKDVWYSHLHLSHFTHWLVVCICMESVMEGNNAILLSPYSLFNSADICISNIPNLFRVEENQKAV